MIGYRTLEVGDPPKLQCGGLGQQDLTSQRMGNFLPLELLWDLPDMMYASEGEGWSWKSRFRKGV